jgi:hypothetical protein
MQSEFVALLSHKKETTVIHDQIKPPLFMVMVVLMSVKSPPYDNWGFPISPSTLKQKKKRLKFELG